MNDDIRSAQRADTIGNETRRNALFYHEIAPVLEASGYEFHSCLGDPRTSLAHWWTWKSKARGFAVGKTKPTEADAIVDALNDFATRAKEWHSELTAYTEITTPAVVVVCDGGLVQDVLTDRPCDVAVLDYDKDGIGEDDLIDIPQDDGTTEKGRLYRESPEVNPKATIALMELVDAALEREAAK